MTLKNRTIIIIIFALLLILAFYLNKEQLMEKFGNTIPLDIYQTWHSSDLPPKMELCIKKLKLDNPEFEHHLFNSDDCRNFIDSNFDKNVVCAYDKLIPRAFKADLWRYCVMYKKGGVYLDIKYQMENGFKLIDLVDKERFVKESFGKEYIYNGFIISKPNNSLWLKCINKIVDNVNSKTYGNQPSVPTGPALVYSFFNKSKYNYDDIDLYYSETNGRGFIRMVSDNKPIMSHYPEYRSEQKNSNIPYWQDLWRSKNIYKDGVCNL